MTSRGCGVLTIEHFEKKKNPKWPPKSTFYHIFATRQNTDMIEMLFYVSRHEEFDSTIIYMKKCKESKIATINMLQMVADYVKKDYISCSANKKHKNMTKLIFHVLSYEENYVRSEFREILTFLSISPLHLHHVGRTCRCHLSGLSTLACTKWCACHVIAVAAALVRATWHFTLT